MMRPTSIVEASAEGVRLLPVRDTGAVQPKLISDAQADVSWLYPTDDAEVGWRTMAELNSGVSTERLTLLVRPRSGSTFFVQPGARSLSAGRPESFAVELGGGRELQIGEEFDILAVCSNAFRPEDWALEADEIPHSRVVGSVTVRKAAGGAKGGADFDLTAEQAAALFANMIDVELDTNINDMEIKSHKAASVSGKLSKLRNMRRK